MLTSLHMQSRMTQRSFTPAMVSAILDLGTSNTRGDRLLLDQRSDTELQDVITDKRRARRQLDREIRDLERLRKKGPVTVVTADDTLITVYRNTRNKKSHG
jgi:hypothetical protein